MGTTRRRRFAFLAASCLPLIRTSPGIALAAQESGPAESQHLERVFFYQIDRKDLNYLGLATPESVREPLEREMDAVAGAQRGKQVWVASADLSRLRERTVTLAVPRGCVEESLRMGMTGRGFKVERLLVTAIQIDMEAARKGWIPTFDQDGSTRGRVGALSRGLHFVTHVAACSPDKLLKKAADVNGRIGLDLIPLRIETGDPGVAGSRVKEALRGLRGVRLASVDKEGRHPVVEVEMRALEELRFVRGKGAPILTQGGGAALGAPIAPIVERLKHAGLEAVED